MIYMRGKNFAIGWGLGENTRTGQGIGWSPTVCQGGSFSCRDPEKIHIFFLCTEPQRGHKGWSVAPFPEVWILWRQCSSSLVNLHRPLLSTPIPNQETCLQEGWGLGAGGSHRNAKGYFEHHLFKMLDSICKGSFRITTFLALILKSCFLSIQKQITFEIAATFLIRWKQTSLYLLCNVLFALICFLGSYHILT